MPLQVAGPDSEAENHCTNREGSGCIRVLHVNAGNMYGGVETMLTTLARCRELCSGMEPHFAVCYEGRLSSELAAAGAPVHLLGRARFSRPWTVWRARHRLSALLREQRFDVVVCHMLWSLAVFGAVARAAGPKVILWAHGFSDRRSWLDLLARRVVPDGAVANSRFTSVAVRNQFPQTPLEVIYCPLELVEATDSDAWRAALRRELGAGDNTTVILQVSRLEPWKGQLVLLRALAQLATASRWVCWIAGGAQTRSEDQYLSQLKQAAQQLGIADRVRFLGQRSDVAKLLAAADIFCQPNEGPEPFGIAFVEALWAGRPVVTSALGGALEVIDETCGVLEPPGQAGRLAESLRRLIDSPALRRQLGSKGPARARELSDPAGQMKKLMKFVRGSR